MECGGGGVWVREESENRVGASGLQAVRSIAARPWSPAQASEMEREREQVQVRARAAIISHVREILRRRATAALTHPKPTLDHDALSRWETVTVTISQQQTGTSPHTSDTLLKIGLAADENGREPHGADTCC